MLSHKKESTHKFYYVLFQNFDPPVAKALKMIHFLKKSKNQKRGKRFTGSMRVIHCRSPEPVVVFRYEDSATKANTIELLDDYKGIFLSDGSTIYDLGEKPEKSEKHFVFRDCGMMTHAECLVHARRKFLDLLPTKDTKLDRRTLTGRMLRRFARLYQLEKQADKKGFSLQERREMRNTTSRKIMEWMKRDMERALMSPGPRPSHRTG